jgi:hypothetical protein
MHVNLWPAPFLFSSLWINSIGDVAIGIEGSPVRSIRGGRCCGWWNKTWRELMGWNYFFI